MEGRLLRREERQEEVGPPAAPGNIKACRAWPARGTGGQLGSLLALGGWGGAAQ